MFQLYVGGSEGKRKKEAVAGALSEGVSGGLRLIDAGCVR